MKWLGYCFIVMMCAGCSPDKGKNDVGLSARSSAEVPAAQARDAAPEDVAPVTDNRPVLVCFGDSLTAGYGVESTHSYPSVLQRNLDAAGYAYRVVNLGISGETSKDGLLRIGTVLRLKPQIAVVEFGGNDGLRGVPVADTERNLDAIVAALTAAGIHVAIAGISLPPQFGQDYVSRFVAVFPAVAHKYHVPLLPFIYTGVYGGAGNIQDDQIHATAQGNILVAKNIEGLVRPLLRK